MSRRNNANNRSSGGDRLRVGDISGSQGIAIGRAARATVRGNVAYGADGVDPELVRAAFIELHTALGSAQLPPDVAIKAQTAVGNALEAGVQGQDVKAEGIAINMQKVGQALHQADVTVQEGSSLWQSVQRLAFALGSLYGGARIVGSWFGIQLPDH